MDFEHLYSLGDASIRGALHVNPRDNINDPYALLRREVIPTEPIVFKYSMGGEPKDLISTGHAVLYLLADRVFEIFRENHFTGWASYPVVIYGKKGELITGYQGLAISGKCDPLDNSRSQRILKDPLTPKGKPYYALLGLYFDLNTWDGSDFFVPRSTGYIFVTERVKEAIEKAKMKNFEFKRLTEIERNEALVKK